MLLLKISSDWPQIAYQKNETINFRESSKKLVAEVEQNFAPSLTSLSHTQSYSFVAFTKDEQWIRVGIDAEEKNRKILGDVKRKIIKDLDCPETKELETLYIWTAKEAAFKTFSFLGAHVIGEMLLEQINGNTFEVFYIDSNKKKHSARGIWIELCDHIVALCRLYVGSK